MKLRCFSVRNSNLECFSSGFFHEPDLTCEPQLWLLGSDRWFYARPRVLQFLCVMQVFIRYKLVDVASMGV